MGLKLNKKLFQTKIFINFVRFQCKKLIIYNLRISLLKTGNFKKSKNATNMSTKCVSGVSSSAKNRYNKTINDLQYEKEELKNLDADLMNQIDFSFGLLQKLENLYEHSGFEVKQSLIGSIFPENLIFSKNKYRTTHLNNVLALLTSNNRSFEKNKNGQTTKKSHLPTKAPPLGLEPRTL